MSFADASFASVEHQQLTDVKWLLRNQKIHDSELDPRGFSHLLVAVENQCSATVHECVAQYDMSFSTNGK
jgi:hypothetical protein